jgi:hypothetical protein
MTDRPTPPKGIAMLSGRLSKPTRGHKLKDEMVALIAPDGVPNSTLDDVLTPHEGVILGTLIGKMVAEGISPDMVGRETKQIATLLAAAKDRGDL